MAINIGLQSNLDSVRSNIQSVLTIIRENNDPILIAGASAVLSLMADRIHAKGLRGDGSRIGTYNNAYLRVRQSKYNRTADAAIILSLTGQMERDFTVIAEGGGVGIGFLNPFNLQKAEWMEGLFPGTYVLSSEEEDVLVETIENYINDLFA